MVSAAVSDALFNPSKSLTDLHSKQPETNTNDFVSTVASHFAKIFESDSAFQQIFPLDIAHPPSIYNDRALVRFRAMVQDTSESPEVYLASMPGSGTCGGWGLSDDASQREDVLENSPLDYSNLRERSVVWAVSVPGESQWVSEFVNLGTDTPTDGATKTSQPSRPHKFPMPGTAHLGVQVKIYDASADSLKPTEIRTFVGILTNEPISTAGSEVLQVPTLHVLYSKPHPVTLVPFSFPFTSVAPEQENVAHPREEIVQWIAEEALGGDKEAAEWVLAIAIARVQPKSTTSFNPPSLTISSFPPPLASTPESIPSPTLVHVLSLLLPLSLHVPLSLKLLNESLFEPESKDEDLFSGVLQLPASTTIIVSDSQITDGTLKEKGLRNVQTLQQCITAQTISYAFPYSAFPFNTDFSFILLSEGKKTSILETSINIPIRPSPNALLYKSKEDIKLPTPSKLASFRASMGGAKIGTVSVGTAVAERIQNDFVEERQKKGSNAVTPEDLELRLAVSRLMALSLHEKELSETTWERVKILDEERKKRFSS